MKPNAERAPIGCLSLFGLALLILFGFVFFVWIPPIREFFGLLVFGWISYMREVLPRVTFNAEIAFCAAVTLTLATWGLHAILRWLAERLCGGSAPWRPGWSVKITAMVLLLFAASIAATGIVHQAGWLFKIKNWTYSGREMLSEDLSNLKQASLALHMYASDHGGAFPHDLDELVPQYSSSHSIFFSRLIREEPPERILYFPNNRAATPEKTIILATPHPMDGERVAGYRDGSVRRVEATEVEQELRLQRTN